MLCPNGDASTNFIGELRVVTKAVEGGGPETGAALALADPVGPADGEGEAANQSHFSFFGALTTGL